MKIFYFYRGEKYHRVIENPITLPEKFGVSQAEKYLGRREDQGERIENCV